MTQNHESYDPRELIDLFLDGEADGIQRDTLFAAMTGNSDLQAEFQTALQFRAAVEYDRRTSTPPASLSNDLFRRAGFAAPAPQRIAVLPAISGKSGGGMLRSLIGALLAAALGIVGTVLWQHGNSDNRSQQASRDELSQGSLADSLVHGQDKYKAMALAAQARADSLADLLAAVSLTSKPKYEADAISTNPQTQVGIRGRLGLPTEYGPDSRLASPSSAGSVENDYPTSVAEALEAVLPEIQHATMMKGLSSRMTMEVMGSGADGPITSGFNDFSGIGVLTGSELPDGLALQLRGISGLLWLPDRDLRLNGAGPWFNNMSVGLLYSLDEYIALGAEAGQETFPLYVAEADGRFDRNPRIVWLGGLLQLQGDEVSWLGGLRPYAQLTLGGTRSGPMGRLFSGLALRLDQRVNLALGIEANSVAYKLRDSYFTTGKLGVSYLMNIYF